MKTIDLDIYREYYADSALADIWDKISDVLENHGLAPAPAEYVGLQIAEWIRTTWGGFILVERHIEDPKGYSRFDLLRERAVAELEKIPVFMIGGPGGIPAVAAEITQVVRVDYLGKYIVKIKKLEQLQRDMDIYNKANSHAQMEQMSSKHGISVVRVYQINAALVKSKSKREQPMLPGVA